MDTDIIAATEALTSILGFKNPKACKWPDGGDYVCGDTALGQVIMDKSAYNSRWRVQLSYSSDVVDYLAEGFADTPVDALLNAVNEARTHIRATLALLPQEPVEWAKRADVWALEAGCFELTVWSDGWTVEVLDKRGEAMQVERGDETGDEGKAAAYAAYLRACGVSQ